MASGADSQTRRSQAALPVISSSSAWVEVDASSPARDDALSGVGFANVSALLWQQASLDSSRL